MCPLSGSDEVGYVTGYVAYSSSFMAFSSIWINLMICIIGFISVSHSC